MIVKYRPCCDENDKLSCNIPYIQVLKGPRFGTQKSYTLQNIKANMALLNIVKKNT